MTEFEALFATFPLLETSRLLLRPLRPSDAQAVYDVFSDTAVTRYYDQPTYTEMSQAEGLITRMRQRFAERRTIRWAIARRADDWLLGTCGYNDWKRHFNCAGIGYELGPAFWRQGIMTEVLTAVLQFGFKQMQLNRVEAYVMRGNTPSMNLLRRLNFQEEGILREYGYWGRAYHDLHLFALLKRDFEVPGTLEVPGT